MSDLSIQEEVMFREMDDAAQTSLVQTVASYERYFFAILASRVTIPHYKRAATRLKIDQQERRRLAAIRNMSQGWSPEEVSAMWRKYDKRRRNRRHG